MAALAPKRLRLLRLDVILGLPSAQPIPSRNPDHLKRGAVVFREIVAVKGVVVRLFCDAEVIGEPYPRPQRGQHL